MSYKYIPIRRDLLPMYKKALEDLVIIIARDTGLTTSEVLKYFPKNPESQE